VIPVTLQIIPVDFQDDTHAAVSSVDHCWHANAGGMAFQWIGKKVEKRETPVDF
jgi:hypothetical protein